MKVLVVGSIGKIGEGRRQLLVDELTAAGIEVVTVGQAYEDKDWRDYFDEAQTIVAQAEKYIEENTFDAVVADLSAASDGRSHQLGKARQMGIPTFGFAPVKVSSPFWLQVDELSRNFDDLVKALQELGKTNR